ncbi:MAG: hypothetical protein IKU24_00840, partial [Clostridia bacterium]|nr:hypothetical protein [Clostridia bacterium]
MAESIRRSSESAKGISAELVHRAASGDEQAFAALAAHFQPVLSRMISSLPIPEAEKGDLRQEGLIGLYKAVRL